ncbi:hypothetical protein PPSIR1_29403 [Plesiocystis pacifica SIR-1]|uniref:Uncharacterized protein n=1 Tax=Plesiocystis pacifica SIR-1 TaxID=391625 RepID=A6G648_9BACT|nr:hypothetical protein [Plesiocystis pacifica]EDM78650.1 hypothetical protein PPSIR1_29403 [Plesiocystis pacifica SIR-1]
MNEDPDTRDEPDSFRQRYGALIKWLAAAKLVLVTIWLFSPYTPLPVIPVTTIDRCDQAQLEAAVQALEAERTARLETIETVDRVDELQAELLLDLSEAIDDACRVSPHYVHARLTYTSGISSRSARQHRGEQTSALDQPVDYYAGLQGRVEFARRCEGDEPYGIILSADDSLAKAKAICGPSEPHFYTPELLLEAYLIEAGVDPDLALRAVSIDAVGLTEEDYRAMLDAEFGFPEPYEEAR